jgi:hypothetical protein
MSRPRPCRVCKKWFRPDRRVGDRQGTCGAADCQRERHRRACAEWHRWNPDYDREDRLRDRLKEKPAGLAPLSAPPMSYLDRAAARDAVGLEVVVLLEVVSKLLWSALRDAVAVQSIAGRGVAPQVPRGRARDDMAGRQPPA